MTLEGSKAKVQYSHSSAVPYTERNWSFGVEATFLTVIFIPSKLKVTAIDTDNPATMPVNICQTVSLTLLGTGFVGFRRFEALKSSLLL